MVNPISICAVGSIAKKDRKKANNQSIALLYLLKVSSLVEVEEVLGEPNKYMCCREYCEERQKESKQSINRILYLLKVSSLVEVEEVVCYPGGDGEEGQLLLALLLGQGQGVEQLKDKEDPPGLFTTH